MGRNLSDDAYKATYKSQKIITDEITKLLDNAQIPPELANFRTRLNQFYREGATSFNKPIAQKLLNDQFGREKIYTQIIANSDQPSLVKNYLKVLKLHSNEEYMLNKKKSIYDLIPNNKKSNKKLYFIDCYRNPIERKISCFFSLLNREKYSLSCQAAQT
jgi:hypothetical protein